MIMFESTGWDMQQPEQVLYFGFKKKNMYNMALNLLIIV